VAASVVPQDSSSKRGGIVPRGSTDHWRNALDREGGDRRLGEGHTRRVGRFRDSALPEGAKRGSEP